MAYITGSIGTKKMYLSQNDWDAIDWNEIAWNEMDWNQVIRLNRLEWNGMEKSLESKRQEMNQNELIRLK